MEKNEVSTLKLCNSRFPKVSSSDVGKDIDPKTDMTIMKIDVQVIHFLYMGIFLKILDDYTA